MSKTLRQCVDDDGLAKEVACRCHDPHHDDRWCSTCQARADGIEEYRLALKSESGPDPLARLRELADSVPSGNTAYCIDDQTRLIGNEVRRLRKEGKL